MKEIFGGLIGDEEMREFVNNNWEMSKEVLVAFFIKTYKERIDWKDFKY